MKTFALLSVIFVASSAIGAERGAALSTVDSPLVAAAKRTHRLGKKPAILITNENLKTMSGPARITSTDHVSAAPAQTPPAAAGRPPAADGGKVPQPAPAVSAQKREGEQNPARSASEEGSSESRYADTPSPAAIKPAPDPQKEPVSSAGQPRSSENTSTPAPPKR